MKKSFSSCGAESLNADEIVKRINLRFRSFLARRLEWRQMDMCSWYKEKTYRWSESKNTCLKLPLACCQNIFSRNTPPKNKGIDLILYPYPFESYRVEAFSDVSMAGRSQRIKVHPVIGNGSGSFGWKIHDWITVGTQFTGSYLEERRRRWGSMPSIFPRKEIC